MNAKALFATVAVALLAACSYDDLPAESSAKMDAVPADCSGIGGWSFVQTNVLRTCAGSTCHSAGNDRAVVVLEPENAYANLVGAPSETLASMKLVEPRRPSRSFFYRKVTGTHPAACTNAQKPADACGDTMPLNAWDALPEQWLEETRAWIACGANP